MGVCLPGGDGDRDLVGDFDPWREQRPELDPIAWYGGNSGVGFELDNGDDSSDWPEKQYPTPAPAPGRSA